MRVTVGAPLRMADFPAPGFAAVDVQWFAGLDGALANDAWLRAAAPGRLGVGDDGIGPARGGSWPRRWCCGGRRTYGRGGRPGASATR